MKKVFYIVALFSSIVFSQVPQGISHRGTVYDTTGALVSGHPVIIKTSILEGTTIVYSETHTLMTNSTGQYSLNIGTSTTLNPPNVLFNTINWGNGINKELKVEIDPTGTGSSFPIVGQNQLMSVPYALYSLNSQTTNADNSLRILNNINELRNVVGNLGDVIYIKAHTNINDGGGGNFIWRNDSSLLSSTSPHSVFSDDNDGTIIQAKNDDGTFNDTGRWVRQFNGYIDVRYFGVPFIGGTQKLQNAINFASYNVNIDNAPTRGATIFFPSGAWVIDKILLKNGISIIGDSSDKTLIYSTNSSDSDFTNSPYLFEMDKGPIRINISNLKIVGRETSKGCFNFNADLNGIYNYGGLTLSTFKNISISGFNGNGIYMRGESGVKLNQLCTFESVYVNRQTDTSNALKIDGYAGQMTFLNCGFGGKDPSCSGCPYNNGSSVDIKNIGANYATTISFINSTFSSSDYGINMSFAENITIDNCWFENTGIAINISSVTDENGFHPCKSINIINSRFSNASGFGSIPPLSGNNTTHMGRCINVINSFVNILNNYIHVSSINSSIDDDYFVMTFGNEGVNLQGNSFSDVKLNRTEGIMPAISVTVGASINCKKNKVVFVNSSSTLIPSNVVIKEIISDLNVGETVFIRANGGNISFWDASKTGSTPPSVGRNIYLSSALTAAPNGILTLKNGEAAVFTKIYDQQYQLTSIIRSNTP